MQTENQTASGQPALAANSAAKPIAIICGGGSFPGAVAEAAKRRGRIPIMLGIKGWADPKVLQQYTHHWVALGQGGRLISLAHKEGCREAVFIGTLLRPRLGQIRLDWRTLRAMPRIARAYRGGDDQLLSGVASLFEEGDLRIIGLDELAPEIFAPEGLLGRFQPSERDRADVARALKVIAALGPFDIGQAAVVADNNVVGIEAAEGTDNLLARIADLRRQRRIATPPGVGVLVKAPKPPQDRRFDLPSIGPRTIENAARAGLAGVAVAAGSTIIAEAAQVIAAADRERIFVLGVGADSAQ